MNIVVCIKQVPDVDDIKWTKENNLDRTNMLSKINPHDEWALDWAIQIKSKFDNVEVTAISMGPPKADNILEYALAKGASRAILLSDKLFSGSDTYVTSKILAKAIEKFIPNYNLILTGQLACDGDTAQVPVSLAQFLNIPDVISVDEIFNADNKLAIVAQKVEGEIKILEINAPCLLAINNKAKNSIKPKIKDYIRAQNSKIEVYNSDDLELDKKEIGIIGSPTMVYSAFRPEIKKDTKEIKQDYVNNLLEIISKVK